MARAICRLSARDPDAALIGFTPWDITEEIGKLRGVAWSSPDDKNQMSKDVRAQWKKLEELWDIKNEGVRQRFADIGQARMPTPARAEGGGTGNPTRYRFDWTAEERSNAPEPSTSLPPGAIRYIREDTLDAGILARPFVGGWEISGYRRLIVILSILIPGILVELFIVDYIFATRRPGGISVAHILENLFATGAIVASFWFFFGSLVVSGTRRIVRAPDWMSFKYDDLLLERQNPPLHPVKAIMAVRYTATCAHCGGRVEIKSGGLAFWGRLVGRCANAPAEHVYSFDHILRIGHDLRRHERS